jgi:hypothetical protein
MQTQFTTIAVADLMDALCSAVDTARAATNDPRWLRAIDSAWDYILSVDTLDYDAATHSLRVPSASGNGEYIANGACQCRAFEQSNACWHRAAARLVRRAIELDTAQRRTLLIARISQARAKIAA